MTYHCVIFSATKATKFKITDIKLYVLVVTLSTQDNIKLIQKLSSGFTRTINWNKYQTKASTERQNNYLDFLIDSSFQGVNRLFALSFENKGDKKVHTGYYLAKVEIKDYNIMIDGENVFDQPVKIDMRTYNNIRKIAAGQGDDYTSDCFLDYIYFKDCCNMVAMNLSKQQEFGADPKAIQQINFTRNLVKQ